MEDFQLMAKLKTLPGDLQSEVSDFIDFLLVKEEKKKVQKIPKLTLGNMLKRERVSLELSTASEQDDLKAFVY